MSDDYINLFIALQIFKTKKIVTSTATGRHMKIQPVF